MQLKSILKCPVKTICAENKTITFNKNPIPPAIGFISKIWLLFGIPKSHFAKIKWSSKFSFPQIFKVKLKFQSSDLNFKIVGFVCSAAVIETPASRGPQFPLHTISSKLSSFNSHEYITLHCWVYAYVFQTYAYVIQIVL